MDIIHQRSVEGPRYKRAWNPSADRQQHRLNKEGNQTLGKHGPGTPMKNPGKMKRM
jgi:hypothetical protein